MDQNKDILYKRCKNLIQNLTKEMQYPADEHGARKIQLIQFAWSVNDLLRDHMQEIDDADFLLYLSRIYMDIANYSQAFALLRRCIRIYDRQESTIVKLISCYNQIGCLYREIYGNPYNEDISYIIRNAGQCYTEIAGIEIYRIWKEHRKATDEETIFIHENLNLALNSLEEALTLLQQDPSRFGFDIAQIYGAAALVYEKKGEFDEAEKCFHRAIHDTILYRNETHPKLAHLYHNYGLMLDSKGRTQEAVDNLRLAENILIINGVDENSDNYQTVKMAIDAILNSM